VSSCASGEAFSRKAASAIGLLLTSRADRRKQDPLTIPLVNGRKPYHERPLRVRLRSILYRVGSSGGEPSFT
jgi:hypothetical protein